MRRAAGLANALRASFDAAVQRFFGAPGRFASGVPRLADSCVTRLPIALGGRFAAVVLRLVSAVVLLLVSHVSS
jgi:hypothetical protein